MLHLVLKILILVHLTLDIAFLQNFFVSLISLDFSGNGGFYPKLIKYFNDKGNNCLGNIMDLQTYSRSNTESLFYALLGLIL